MNFEAYKDWVYSRVNLEKARVVDRDGLEDGPVIFLGALGLMGEAGEVADCLKKHLFHGKPITQEMLDNLQLEMGDLLWYFALLCEQFEFTLDDIIKSNIRKLEARDGVAGEKFHQARGCL